MDPPTKFHNFGGFFEESLPKWWWWALKRAPTCPSGAGGVNVMFRHQISLHRHHWDCVDIFDLQWWRIDWNWTKNLNWLPGAVRAPDGDAWKRSWGWRRCWSVHHVQRGKPTWLLIHVCWLIRQIKIPTEIHGFYILSFFQVRNTEDSSYRNLRDWYIYRDYMNGLEYVIHAFDHLKKHHQ